MTVLAALLGCSGDPISNALFYEDEAFLAALPSSSDLGPPAALLAAPAGDSTVLADASVAASDLDLLLAPLVASGEAVRAATPDERSEVHRAWDAVTVVTTTDEGVAVWWVECGIVRPEDGPIEWTLAGAAADDGAYAAMAEGSLADGAVSASWDAGASAAWVGAGEGTVDISGTIALVDGEQRDVGVDQLDAAGVPVRSWELRGEEMLAWTGTFALTGDLEAWPGWAVALHRPEGGRAAGTIHRGTEDIAFEACWDDLGNTVWIAGDADVTPVGDEASCASTPPE